MLLLLANQRIAALLTGISSTYAIYSQTSNGLVTVSSVSNGGQIFVFLFFLIFIIAELVLIRKSATRSKEDIFLTYVVCIAVVLGIVFSKQVLISRMTTYFAIFVIIYIPKIISQSIMALTNNWKSTIATNYLVSSVVILITLIPMTVQLIRNISGVVPYVLQIT